METKKIVISDSPNFNLRDSFEKNRIAARGIVIDEDNNILIERLSKYNFLTLPGGGLNPGELPEKAFIREVLEETGIQCEILHVFPEIIELRYKLGAMQTNYCYLAKKIEQNLDVVSLDDHEEKDGLQIEWYPAMTGFQALMNQNPQTLQQTFLATRDKTILQQAALEIFNKTNLIIKEI